MLKYLNTEVTFAEIPDEITLCINITGCPNHCPGCHSQFLWHDVGEPLTPGVLDIIIPKNKGISCVCFMGGDQDPSAINDLAIHVRKTFPDLKIAWYSGNNTITEELNFDNFDYIKIGSYNEELGGLDKKTTNQKLFKLYGPAFSEWVDITYKFWKNEKDI